MSKTANVKVRGFFSFPAILVSHPSFLVPHFFIPRFSSSTFCDKIESRQEIHYARGRHHYQKT